MKIIKNSLLSIILFLFFNSSYSQQKTVYEKKVDEINLSFLKKLGVSETQISRAKEMGNIEGMFMGLGIMEKLSTMQGLVLMEQYNNELKKAENLKTEVDFKKDKIKKNKEIALQKAIEQKKILELYNNSDYSIISKNIKSEFENWTKKGEFEKEADYFNRLQIKSQNVFEEICLKQINDKINNYNVDYNLRKELSTYNSEGEYFMIVFKINNVEWQNKINIPISKAENFKNNWSQLKFKVDDYDWCFVENSLSPTLVKLEENYKYEFPLSTKNQSEIIYPFANTKINNPYLQDYIFKYSNAKVIAKKIEKEKKLLDSLELSLNNQKLDSIFKNYNNQLLKNQHNINKEIIDNYKKVTRKDNIESDFSDSVYSMKYTFESLTNKFENEYQYEYRTNLKLFTNKEEFDNFYSKGDEFYQSEIGKKTVLNILKTNSNFIELMNFQKDKRESVGSAIARGLLSNINNGSNTSTIDYSNENRERQHILSLINENKDKSYYPQIMDFVIETNKSLNKEWSKNGHFFENKQLFYKSYLSEDYKVILKENKEK